MRCGRSSSVEHQLPKLDRRVQFPSPALFNSNFRIIILIFILAGLAGCASAPMVTGPEMPQVAGIYHKVATGETLWRISQAYHVDLDDIVRANRIPDAARIEKGQLVFIPGASTTESAVSFQSSTATNFAWPIKSSIISYFGSNIDNRVNKGIDIKARPQDSISASADGRVTFIDDLRGYGRTIIIEHSNGISTVYAGNLQEAVKLNDQVAGGNLIARVFGDGKQDSLLHFEFRRGYRSQNPLYYLP